MRRGLDEFIIIAYCLIMAAFDKIDAFLIIALLVGIIYICTIEVFKNKWIFPATTIIFLGTMTFLPMIFWFFPLCLYGMLIYKNGFLLGVATAVFLFSTFKYANGNEIKAFILIFLGCLIAITIYYKTKEIKKFEERLKRTRDDGVELQILLEEKNRNLREKQDYEIYTATLRERNRIAREIHDSVGHMLSRAILMTGALKAINTEKTLDKPIEELDITINGAMTSVRESVHDLHDEAVDMEKAILDIINDFTFAKVHFQYQMEKSIKVNVKYSFIAIIKEALNNSMKHSNAQNINISIRDDESIYELVIEDDGDITKKPATFDNGNGFGVKRGIGLLNIEERVKNLGGKVKFYRENGFKIYVKVPK